MATFHIPTGPPITERGVLMPEVNVGHGKRPPKPCYGSLTYDLQKGDMMQWPNEDEFLAWLAAEELRDSIKLIVSRTEESDSPNWRARRVFRCSREPSGGKTNQVKKHNRDRKIPSKKTGCKYQLTIKLYPNTEMILGKYEGEHNHPIGNENLRFLRLSSRVRDLVKDMVHTGMGCQAIVSAIQLLFAEPTEFQMKRVRESNNRTDRDYYITMRDIARLRRIVEDNEIHLDDNDAISIRLWVTRLRQGGVGVVLKDKRDPAPPGSGVDNDCFILCLQTEFQRDRFQALGSDFLSIDATHNTTQYAGVQLFTLIVRDLWGHGVPVAWMMASSGTQATIQFFLNFVKDRSPEIVPRITMSDRDQAQLNAVKAVYPETQLLLCWWHVLRAMRMHFRTEEFPELWVRVREWVKTPDQATFDSLWEWIQTDSLVPQSFVAYLKSNWMSIVSLWAGISRQNRTIYQEGDTNMLIEAYHHVLKSKWLEGKHNRHVDHLIHTLVVVLLPSYANRHDRQELGFDGPDLANKRRQEILARTPEIKAESIRNLGDDQFSVQSAMHSSRLYSVELGAQSCDCPDWPRVQFCKHVAAVAHHFGNSDQQIEAISQTVKPIREVSLGAQSDGSSATSIVENVIAVSKAFLDDGVPSSPATVRSLQLVESHLTAVVRNSQSSADPLPDKDIIPPNQGTWAKTAERMGATRKRKRPRPTTVSSPDPPPATELIGELNRKKLRIKLTDPYSGGVSSWKCAEPDARSAAQNTEARAHEAAAASGASLPSQPKRGRKRAVIPSPSFVPLPPPTSIPSMPPHLAIPSAPWYTVHASPTTQGYPVAATPATAVPTESVPSQRQDAPATSSARQPPAFTPAWYPTQPGYPQVYWPYV